VTIVDGGGYTGHWTSIAIGSDGFGLISYMDMPDAGIEVAHCLDLACTTSEMTTIDRTAGEYSSIAIGPDGLGMIAFRDSVRTALKVAYCADLACTTTAIVTVDDEANVGTYPSITIGRDGFGLIAYVDETTNRLKVAHLSSGPSSYSADPPEISTFRSAGSGCAQPV
jgi:hypothetical protein